MDTKQTLLTHAETLARSRGIDAFSFADLAKAAEIRKPSVHHHFATKADLSLRLIDSYAERTLTHLAEAEGAPAAARLAHILDLYRTALQGGDSLCLCVSFTASLPSLSDATRARVALFQQEVQAWLRALFHDAQTDGTITGVNDPQAEADACFALLEGAQLAARASGQVQSYDQATRLLRNRIRPEEPQ